MLQNAFEAEDLTQDVFIQLYRKIGSFRGDSAFTTWLHRLTVNQVLMHFRKRNVKFEKTTEEGETPEQTVPGTENPFKMPIVDKIALESAIDQLPAGYKNVFVSTRRRRFRTRRSRPHSGLLGRNVKIAASQGASEAEKASKEESQPELVGYLIHIRINKLKASRNEKPFFVQ